MIEIVNESLNYVWLNNDGRTLQVLNRLPNGVRNYGIISDRERVLLTGDEYGKTAHYNDDAVKLLSKSSGVSSGTLQAWNRENLKKNPPAPPVELKEPEDKTYGEKESGGLDLEPENTVGLRDYYDNYLKSNDDVDRM